MCGETSNFLLSNFSDIEQNVFVFDSILLLLKNTDILENDNILHPEPDLSVSIYKISHKKLYSLMWFTKYGKSLFLPKYWAILYFMYNNKCNNCSKMKANKYFKSSTVQSLWCRYEKYEYFTNEAVDKLYSVIFDLKNYCIMCRRALFDIVDVEENEKFKCFKSCCV